MDKSLLRKLATSSPVLEELYQNMSSDVDAMPPFHLGFPSDTAQSSYYPGDTVNESDANTVSKILEQNTIFAENTRLQWI